MTVTTNYTVTGNGITGTTADAVQALVSADGIQSFAASQALTPSAALMSLADYETQWSAPRMRALTLPNPYPAEANAPVHPSLVSFPARWNGYLYWLAYTPYPGAAAAFENPCVVASNDLITWVSPAPNPLVPYPGGTSYNADTHLFMSADSATMYLAFRERGVSAENRLKIMHTMDGVSWSAPVTILTGAVGTLDFGSPSIWWNGTGWTMISGNLDAASPWPLQRRVSDTADVYGAWGSPTTVTMAPLAGRAWWHTCMVSVGGGHIIGIAQDNSGSPGGSGNLYYVESADDGLTFVVLGIVGTQGGKYRSAIYPRQRDRTMMLDVLIGALAGTITHAEAAPGRIASRNALTAELAAALAAGAALPGGVLFADTATRADSTTTPNPASCGLSYTVSSGTWGVSTNRLYPVATGRLLFAAGTPNHEISARMLDMTTSIQQWVIARAVDGSNYYRVGVVSPTASGAQTLAVQDILAGSIQSTTTVGNISRGDVLSVRSAGATLMVRVNGQCVAEILATRHPTGASVGLQANAGANTFFDDVVVSAAT